METGNNLLLSDSGFLKEVINNISSGVALLSAEATVVWHNPKFGDHFTIGNKIIGMRFGNAIGCQTVDANEALCGHMGECSICVFKRDIETATKYKLKVDTRVVTKEVSRNKQGKNFILEYSVSPFSYNNQHYAVLIVNDVTHSENIKQQLIEKNIEHQKLNDQLGDEKKQIEQINKQLSKSLDQLKRAEAQLVLNEKMSSLGQLTAGIAHEINNPMNFVLAGANTLKSLFSKFTILVKTLEDDLDLATVKSNFPDQKLIEIQTDIEQMIEEVKIGAERTLEVVRNLKNFSRLDEAQIKPLNVAEAVKTTISMIRQEIKNIELTISNSDPNIIIESSAGLINQVLLNILINAIQAMEGVGKLLIEITNNSEQVKITITDNGPGIAPEHLSRIFEPFFTTKEQGKGTGLGLAISYSIVSKLGGKLSAISQVGEGASFIIELPLHYVGNYQLGKNNISLF